MALDKNKMDQLLNFYLNHISFVIIHAILFLYVIISYIRSSGELNNENHMFKTLSTNVEHFIKNGFVNVDENESKGIYYIYCMYQSSLFKPNDDITHIIDAYASDTEENINWAEKTASLFLLSGIAGTLLGIFYSVNNFTAQNTQIIEMLKGAFQAFGVTIFAVIYSTITTLLHIRLSRKTRKNIQLLQLIAKNIIEHTITQPSIIQQQATQVLDITVAKLSEVVNSFQAGIINPEKMKIAFENIANITTESVVTFKELKHLIDHQQSTLQELQNRVNSIPNDIANMNAQLENSLNGFQEKLIKVVNESYETYLQHRSYTKEIMNSVRDEQNEDIQELLEVMNKRLHQSMNQLEEFDQKVEDAHGDIKKVNQTTLRFDEIHQSLEKYLNKLIKITDSLDHSGAIYQGDQKQSRSSELLKEMITLQQTQINMQRKSITYIFGNIIFKLWSKLPLTNTNN